MAPVTGYAAGAGPVDKRALRAMVRAQRRELVAGRDRAADAESIARSAVELAEALGLVPGDWVSAYEARPTEPPTDRLIEAMQARGIRVMVPITLPDLDLDWAEAGGGEPLGLGAIATARVVFLPALSVDTTGTRLGQGGGCYDRAVPRAPGARLVAIVHPWEVRADPLPREEHDRPVEAVITAGAPPRSLAG
jgi:5-formyltetrahydrofolate cyclo-ligase